MFDKLLEQVEQKKNDIQKDLAKVTIEAEAENGLVKVKANGNKKILSIDISNEIIDDKEAMEDLIIVAVNRAVEKSEKVFEEAMNGVAGEMIPGMKNMFGM